MPQVGEELLAFPDVDACLDCVVVVGVGLGVGVGVGVVGLVDLVPCWLLASSVFCFIVISLCT